MILKKGWYYVKYDDFFHPVGPFHSEGQAHAAASQERDGEGNIPEFALVDVVFDNFAWGE